MKVKYRGEMTYDLAMAIGKDAANQQMRKAGRTQWNLDDWNRAAKVFAQVYGGREHEDRQRALLPAP